MIIVIDQFSMAKLRKFKEIFNTIIEFLDTQCNCILDFLWNSAVIQTLTANRLYTYIGLAKLQFTELAPGRFHNSVLVNKRLIWSYCSYIELTRLHNCYQEN